MKVSVFDVKDAFFGVEPRAEVELLAECGEERGTMGFEGDLADLFVEEVLNGGQVEFGVVVSGDDVDLVTRVQERRHCPKYPRIQRKQMAQLEQSTFLIPCRDVPPVVFVGDVDVHKVKQIACDDQAPRLILVGVLGVVVQKGGKLLILEGDTLLNRGAIFLRDLFAEV